MSKIFILPILLNLFNFIFSLATPELNFLRKRNSSQTINLKKASTISQQINAYCLSIYEDVVYDISELYDPNMDYFFHNQSDYFYFNFCKFGSTICKKDSSYSIYVNKTDARTNNTDCNLLSGTNYKNTPKWQIISKYILIILRKFN
jgi:hypothetical protein